MENTIRKACQKAGKILKENLGKINEYPVKESQSRIIEEAGGKVTDMQGNLFDFSLNTDNYDRNFTIVGSNKVLHSELIKILNHGVQ